MSQLQVSRRATFASSQCLFLSLLPRSFVFFVLARIDVYIRCADLAFGNVPESNHDPWGWHRAGNFRRSEAYFCRCQGILGRASCQRRVSSFFVIYFSHVSFLSITVSSSNFLFRHRWSGKMSTSCRRLSMASLAFQKQPENLFCATGWPSRVRWGPQLAKATSRLTCCCARLLGCTPISVPVALSRVTRLHMTVCYPAQLQREGERHLIFRLRFIMRHKATRLIGLLLYIFSTLWHAKMLTRLLCARIRKASTAALSMKSYLAWCRVLS